MNPSERVAVVVGANKRHKTLKNCLKTLQPVLLQPGDLFFVDNGSRDGVGDWVAKDFPGCTIVRLKRNQLYCGGYNAGIRMAMDIGYPFVLIINSDTEVLNPLFLGQLLEVSQRWPRAAFIGPLVFLRAPEVVQQTCLQYPRVWRNAITWLPWRVAPLFFKRQPREETAVEFLNGVCMLCRVEALREIGLMDERFGGYVEDADWAWRAREKGWESVFAPVPSIIHHEEPFGYEPYSLKTFLLKRNTVLWHMKVGWRRSAFSYAYSSLILSWARMKTERSAVERKKHTYFLRRLSAACRGILRESPLDEWFGPPIGNWDEGIIQSTWIST
jgi:GT2 family glycosyltransferase